MKRHRTLAARMRLAEQQRDKYWSDPERRLKVVNATRRRKGLPPHQSIVDIATQGPRF